MEEFHKEAIKTALKSMFEGNHFNICVVRHCMKLTGCIANSKDFQALEALHCVDWSEMPPELRNMVFAKTMQIFESPGFDVELIGNALRADTKMLN